MRNFFFICTTILSVGAFSEESLKVPTVPTAGEISKAMVNPNGTPNKMREQVEAAKSLYKCKDEHKRLTNDVTFFTKSNAEDSTKILGNFQEGVLPGNISDLYIGRSSFSDLMFVTKVKSGSKVIGYNVTLSFCEVENAYKGMESLISNKTRLTNFSASKGIMLSKDSNCSHGMVSLAATTTITVQNGNSGPTSLAPTSFLKTECISGASEIVPKEVADDARGLSKPTSIDSSASEKPSNTISK